VHCPQCGVNIANPGTNCPTCNANLMQSCPQCNFKNLIGQQFCGHCKVDIAAVTSRMVEEVVTPVGHIDALVQFPIISVELMNLERLGDKLDNPQQMVRLSRDLMVRMESQLLSQSATIESIRGNVMFFSFRHEKGLREAISKSLKVGIALAKKTINLQDVLLQLRVGMDVIQTDERGPMTAVPERLVAQAGQVVVSYNVYQITNKQLPYEAIGPIKVQGQMRTFFRIMLEGGSAAENVASPPASIELPEAAAATLDEAITDDAVAPAPVNASSAPATEDLPPELQQEAMPTSVSNSQIERKLEPPEHPGPITWDAPEFIGYQASPKKSNIGYDQAILALEAEVKELIDRKDAKGKVIALGGAEGMGKSTIINMLRAQVPADSVIWIGANFYESYGNNRFPLYFWWELMHNLMGFPIETLDREKGEEHMVALLKTMYGEEGFTEDKLVFFKTLLGFNPLQPITANIREQLGQMIPHFMALLTTMSKVRPVVVIMENVEHADVASIELLLQLFQEQLLESRVAILMTYSSNILFLGPLQQAVSLMPFKEYILGPVEESILATLAEAPLAVPWKKLPDTLRAQIVEKGSPMFLEESFRWLSVQGGFSVNPKTGKFTPEKKLKDLIVPEDLGQVIFDRFSGLEEVCRSVLQMASILGERFSATILTDLSQIEQYEEVLKILWQNGFIFPDAGTMARFRHQLIWQVVYASIPAETRAKLHQLVADYLEQARSMGRCISPALIAYHSMMAGNGPMAIQSWNQTGVWLAETGSVTAANLAFAQMQKILEATGIEPDPVQQKRLYESLAILNLDIFPEYAKNLLLTVMSLKGSDTREEEIEREIFLAQAYEKMGAYPHAMSTIHRALEAVPVEGHELERIGLGCQEVWYLYVQGRYQEGVMVYNEEVRPYLAMVGQAPWTDETFRMNYFREELARGRIALMQCNPAAIDIIDKALIKCDVNNEQVMAIHFRLTRSLALLYKGNYDECQREMEDILGQIEGLGHPPEVMVWWGLILLLYHCEMGDVENASLLVPNISYQAEQARDYLAWNFCQALAGRISLAHGHYGEAQKLLEQTVTVAAEYHLSHPALMGWRYLSENDLRVDNLDVAEQICVRAMDISQKPNIRNMLEFYQLNITHAKILIRRGRLKEAGALLEQQWPAMVKSGYTPLVAEASFQISELYGKLGEDLPEPHKSKYLAQQENFLQKAKSLWMEQGNKHRLTPYIKEEGVSLPD
jgi:tetratricopeptide (TPR) repeat protein